MLTFRTRITRLLMVNYAVPVERLLPRLPAQVQPRTFPSLDGEVAFVSVVWMRQEGLRLAALPWPRFSFEELNLRAYVDCGGEPGVYFLQIQADTALVPVVNMLGMSCKRALIEINDEDDDYSAAASGDGGDSQCLVKLGEPLSKPVPPFEEAEAMRCFFTHPLRGVMSAPDGAQYYQIDHSPFEPRVGELADAKCGQLAQWGLVPSDEQRRPHSVLYQAASEFRIFFPPGRLD